MIKRLARCFLSICLVAGLVPALAFADEGSEVFEVGTSEQFAEAVSEINAASNGSFTIKLTDDIILGGDNKFSKNATTILGEGHTLSGGNNATLSVLSGAILNLGSDGYAGSLSIDGSIGASTGPLVGVSGSGSVLNLYQNVTLKNNKDKFGSPGGVQVEEDAVFNMYGGLITGCSLSDAFSLAGGVFINAASFHMFGGTISECSGTYGGGVAAWYVKNDTYSRSLEISGGRIIDNDAKYGGGVFLYSSSTVQPIANCVITGNAAEIGGGVVLMENSSADFSGGGNIVCNNTAKQGAADVFLNSEEDDATLFSALEMNQAYRDSGKQIDGWYKDDPSYVPTDTAVAVDTSCKLKGELALVASYKVTSQAVLTYKLNVDDSDSYGTDEANVGEATVLRSAPSKEGFIFLGWNDGEDTYPAGSEYIPTGDVTFVARWQAIPAPTYYPVSVVDKAPEGGSVSADRSSAPAGSTVTIAVAPDEGYELGSLAVTDKNGNAIPVTSKGDGKYSFTMPAGKVTIAAAFQSARWDRGYLSCSHDSVCPIWPYADANATEWYHDGVHFCIANGLMTGYDATTWAPSDATSRGMVATILWRLEGSPRVDYAMGFNDVEDGAWYSEAVRWAASEGIVHGYGDGSSFGPNDPVTREQMATILWRYAKAKGYDVSAGESTSILDFPDAADISGYAVPAMQWGVGSGMVAGKDAADGSKTLDPQGETDRAQMATLMMRFCAEIVK